jgi:hypothetical protein
MKPEKLPAVLPRLRTREKFELRFHHTCSADPQGCFAWAGLRLFAMLTAVEFQNDSALLSQSFHSGISGNQPRATARGYCFRIAGDVLAQKHIASKNGNYRLGNTRTLKSQTRANPGAAKLFLPVAPDNFGGFSWEPTMTANHHYNMKKGDDGGASM